MIIKVGERGNDPQGIVAYLGGPGDIDEHIDPHIVTASITPTGALDRGLQAQAVADLRLNSVRWPDVQIKGGHVWTAVIAVGKDEGLLGDRVWRGISRDYMQGMEFGDVHWISVNHGPSVKGNDHVHVVASLVTDQGTKANPWQERNRSKKMAIELEDKYGLRPLPGRRLGTGQRPDSQKDLARARDLGLPESRRSQIERTVRASASVVSTVDEFERILKANGLDFHPYKSASGEITGYSVSTPETRTSKGVVHRWAGGKLARDLSLPRLEMVWKSNTSTKPTHIRAVQELQGLQRSLPQADAVALEDASHQLAGALAAVSLATEDPPGELAAASKQAGAYAQTVRAKLRPKPPALSVGALFLFATDPAGPAGKTVMIMQLMAAYRALLDAQFARRALVTTRERTPSMAGQAGPEEEMLEIGVTTTLTGGALLLEHRARAKEAAALATANDPGKDLWDAKKIRQMRKDTEAVERAKTAALKPPPGTEMATHEQLSRADDLAKELDLPSVRELAESLTAREAELYLTRVEATVVRPVPVYTPPLDPETFEAHLEAKHGSTLTPAEEYVEKYASPPADLHRPETWKSGDVPATEPQVKWLTQVAGMSEDEARKMTKAGASSYRNSRERGPGLTQQPKAQKPPPKQGPGLGR